jgi:hypothetical protein
MWPKSGFLGLWLQGAELKILPVYVGAMVDTPPLK